MHGWCEIRPFSGETRLFNVFAPTFLYMKSKHEDDNQKLKQSEELHPIQLFRHFLEVLTPDPVEMEIDPPWQLFHDILGGKKITFTVGLDLRRYYGSPAQLRAFDHDASASHTSEH